MSWEYKFSLYFGERDAWALDFVKLVTTMSENPLFGPLVKLTVRNYRLFLQDPQISTSVSAVVEVHDFIAQPEKNSTDVFHRAIKEYEGEEYMFEALWLVKRFNYTQRPELIKDISAVRLFAFGAAYRDWHGRYQSNGLVYEVGDFKYYPSRIKEVGPANLQLLLDELRCFAKLGARSIRALDAEDLESLRDHSVCYHSSPEGFLMELGLYGLPPADLTPPTRAQIIQAAQGLEHVVLEDLEGGLLVHDRRGTDGNLTAFYAALEALLSS